MFLSLTVVLIWISVWVLLLLRYNGCEEWGWDWKRKRGVKSEGPKRWLWRKVRGSCSPSLAPSLPMSLMPAEKAAPFVSVALCSLGSADGGHLVQPALKGAAKS